MNIEKAKISDVQRIHELVNRFADNGEMLPRALSEIYENLRGLFVIRDNNQVIGCVALNIKWADLAEITSLAVSEDEQDKGLGSLLIEACLNEAAELGISTVFCLTYKPAFFEKHGFYRVDKMELPRKVWSECYRCPKFPDCDEVALVYQLKSGVT
ncbi:MAG: N-acetyltransferase [Chloroflexi bacterium]|nr:N-acetyltransferase [Chloroflexota bacterium]